MNSRKKIALSLLIGAAALIFVFTLSGNDSISNAFREIRKDSKNSEVGDSLDESFPQITKKTRIVSQRAAAIKAANESIRLQKLKAKAAGTDTPAHYKSFGKAGALTNEAALAAKLTDEERKIVANILHAAWENAAAAFKEGVVFDEKNSNVNEEHYIYHIKSVPDQGALALGELRDSLTSAVGKEKQEAIIKGIGRDDCFGGFGNRDIQLELLPREGIFKFEYINPKTGDSTGTGYATIAKFADTFGDTFDLSGMKFAIFNDPREHD